MKDLLCIVPAQKRPCWFCMLLSPHWVDVVQIRTGKNIFWLSFSPAYLEVITEAPRRPNKIHECCSFEDYQSSWPEIFRFSRQHPSWSHYNSLHLVSSWTPNIVSSSSSCPSSQGHFPALFFFFFFLLYICVFQRFSHSCVNIFPIWA